MKKLAVLVTAICFAITFAVFPVVATLPEGDNVIGLYTTADGDGESFQFAGLAESVGFFICVSGCTFEAGIAAYEFCIVQEGDGVAVQAYDYYHTALIDGIDFECPVVGLPAPLLPKETGLIVIGEIRGLSWGTESVFYLRPVETNPYIAGAMVIVDAADFGNVVPVVPASGSHDIPCFYVNQQPWIEVETTTWSRIRRLYR